jgi:hypothetical protein
MMARKMRGAMPSVKSRQFSQKMLRVSEYAEPEHGISQEEANIHQLVAFYERRSRDESHQQMTVRLRTAQPILILKTCENMKRPIVHKLLKLRFPFSWMSLC